MKIFLSELSDVETNLDFSEQDAWVNQAVHAVDEVDEISEEEAARVTVTAGSPRAERAAPITSDRAIRVSFSLRKVDDVVVVSGKISTHVCLICSRCAKAFEHPSRPEFAGLFCKDPVMAGIAHLGEGNRPSGQNHGKARHAHDEEASTLMEQGKDLDITYLSNDYIDLGEVLTEHLQLQIPFQPLCKEDCKGMCAQCGADWNLGRCACSKLARSTPFSVLQNIKTETLN
jgi:uncharacterized protein